MTPPAWCFLCPLSPGAAGVTCQVTGVIFHQGTGPVPALNVTSGVATGGGKGHHGFYYLKPSSLQQQPEKYPGALIFIEVIISAGFSPRLFFFFPYLSFLFFLFAREVLVGRVLFWGCFLFVCLFYLAWDFLVLGVLYCCWVWFRVIFKLDWVGFGRQGLNTPVQTKAGAGEEHTPDLHRLLQKELYQ